jgi:hypothetical protein
VDAAYAGYQAALLTDLYERDGTAGEARRGEATS